MKTSLLAASIVAAAVGGLAAAQASPAFPSFGADTGPGIIFVFGAGGAVTTNVTGQGPYDGNDDSYIGVVNNSGSSLAGFTLSGTSAIFGFDGDGIDVYGSPGNGMDRTGYGGPDTYFTNISPNLENGSVNFINAINPGSGTTLADTTYFSLEGPPSAINVTVGTSVPEPASLVLLGTGLLGICWLRPRRKV